MKEWRGVRLLCDRKVKLLPEKAVWKNECCDAVQGVERAETGQVNSLAWCVYIENSISSQPCLAPVLAGSSQSSKVHEPPHPKLISHRNSVSRFDSQPETFISVNIDWESFHSLLFLTIGPFLSLFYSQYASIGQSPCSCSVIVTMVLAGTLRSCQHLFTQSHQLFTIFNFRNTSVSTQKS